MKKINRILLCVALMLVAGLSLCMSACDFTGNASDGGTMVESGELLSVELVGSMKTTYYTGDSIDFQSAKVKLIYQNREFEVTPDVSHVTGFDTTTSGEKQLVFTYFGVQRTINYTVLQGFLSGRYRDVYYGTYNSYHGRTSEGLSTSTIVYHIFSADGNYEIWTDGALYVSGTWRYEKTTIHADGLDYECDILVTASNGMEGALKIIDGGTRLATLLTGSETNLQVMAHESALPEQDTNPFAD